MEDIKLFSSGVAIAFTDQGLEREVRVRVCVTVCVCVCARVHWGVLFKLGVLKAQHFKKASSSSLAQ